VGVKKGWKAPAAVCVISVFQVGKFLIGQTDVTAVQIRLRARCTSAACLDVVRVSLHPVTELRQHKVDCLGHPSYF
jgi:hypothetical protein